MDSHTEFAHFHSSETKTKQTVFLHLVTFYGSSFWAKSPPMGLAQYFMSTSKFVPSFSYYSLSIPFELNYYNNTELLLPLPSLYTCSFPAWRMYVDYLILLHSSRFDPDVRLLLTQTLIVPSNIL
jgi:hypothetical protein